MFPEKSMIKKEFVVRHMEPPETLTRRGLSRWLAIALGLLGPGDSREAASRILDTVFWFNLHEGKKPSIDEISEISGIEKKTVFYHIGKMRKLGLLESMGGRYSFCTGGYGEPTIDELRRGVNQALDQVETVLKDMTRVYRETRV